MAAPSIPSCWPKVLALSAAGFAVEVAWSVEATYAIPALLRTGLQEKYASMMWAFSPLLGLLFQGYLGSASDRKGRRKPFIFMLALMSCLGMSTFAYGSVLFGSILPGRGFSLVLAAFVFMDFSMDQFSPSVRMLLLDSVPAERSDRANYIYSALMALGALLGSVISGVDWESLSVDIGTTDERSASFDYQLQVVFGIALAVFVTCVGVMMYGTREQRPQLTGSVEPSCDSGTCSSSELLTLDLVSVENKESHHHLKKNGLLPPPLAPLAPAGKKRLPSVGEHTTATTAAVDLCHSQQTEQKRKRSLSPFSLLSCCDDIYSNLRDMKEFMSCLSPHVKLLWVMLVFDYIVLHTLNIFFSDYMGEMVYGGSPVAEDGDPAALLFKRGLYLACWATVLEDVISLSLSLFLEWSSDYVSHRFVLLSGHALFFVALLLAALSASLVTAVLVAVASGVMWAIVNSTPYTLITFYAEKDILLEKPWPHTSDTNGKAVSLLEMAIFLSQFLVAMCMGALIEWFGLQAVMVVGVASIVVATFLSCLVRVGQCDSVPHPPAPLRLLGCVKRLYGIPEKPRTKRLI